MQGCPQRPEERTGTLWSYPHGFWKPNWDLKEVLTTEPALWLLPDLDSYLTQNLDKALPGE